VTETNVIIDTLEEFTELAGAVRADLLDVVEKRYRRRRRGRNGAVLAAVILVVAAVGGGIAVNPFSGTANHRQPAAAGPTSKATAIMVPTNHAKPPAGLVWRLPSTSGTLPKIEATWPAATTSVPAKAPDGAEPYPMAALDSTHLLVSSITNEATGGLYSYDMTTKTFTVLVNRVAATKPAFINRFAISPSWVIYELDVNNAMDIYKIPHTGGTPQRVAQVNVDSGSTSEWTATDQAIYWSDSAGVSALPLSGGVPTRLAGFAEFQLVDGSAWAVRAVRSQISDPAGMSPLRVDSAYVTEEMKNVVTGQDLPVKPAAHALMLTCAPTFCIGTKDRRVSFIQNLADTKSAPMPAALGYGGVFNGGSVPLFVGQPDIGSSGFTLWEPATGKVGADSSPANAKGTDASAGMDGLAGAVLGWQQVAGGPISEYVSLSAIS
jgi:hypothetical protein